MRALLVFAFTALAAPVLAQPMRGVPLADDGWWVVLGSFANNSGSGSRAADAAVARVWRQAQACGESPFNDASDKFSGLASGFEVSVLGAYPTRARAEAALSRVDACVPGAYIRRARYAGE
ncbi:SPOR domain-containing protein [Methylobacterium sp. sgz302541]|uniref:SPOR domain-containing protein n=1 Tax=unclassified Methylobacterium TaxID=2615210 RepID=UPI003D33CAA2